MEGYDSERYTVEVGGEGIGDDLYVVIAANGAGVGGNGGLQLTLHGSKAQSTWNTIRALSDDMNLDERSAPIVFDSYIDHVLGIIT